MNGDNASDVCKKRRVRYSFSLFSFSLIERGDDPPLAGPDVSDDDMSVTIIPKNDRPE